MDNKEEINLNGYIYDYEVIGAKHEVGVDYMYVSGINYTLIGKDSKFIAMDMHTIGQQLMVHHKNGSLTLRMDIVCVDCAYLIKLSNVHVVKLNKKYIENLKKIKELRDENLTLFQGRTDA